MKSWLANAHSTANRPFMPEARLQEQKLTSPFRASQMKKIWKSQRLKAGMPQNGDGNGY